VDPHGKPVSGGEGGIACTNDPAAFQRMLAYCHLHREGLGAALRDGPFAALDREVLGLKWRPHPLGLALASISLASLPERNQRRLAAYQRTLACLAPFAFLAAPRLAAGAQMGGFFGGIKLIYDPARLGGLPLSVLCRALAAEGVPVERRGVGHLEYRRPLYRAPFDLWGQGRGPIGAAWHGLAAHEPPRAADFPVSEAMEGRVLTLPSFIDVEDDYYTGLATALEKLAAGHRGLAAGVGP
jgi:dTDP-4-amino-4,6-dideoxygalactose transaminase